MAAVQDLSAFVPQVWSKKVITRLDRMNVMLGCGAVNKDYEGDIKQQGDTVWVRTYGNVATGKYVRNAPINYSAMAPSKESLVVKDAEYFAIQVDDLDQAQNDLNALNGYNERAAVAINELIDTKLLGYYASAITANQIGSGGVITISASNAYTNLVDAGTKLDQQNVPTEDRWAVIGPAYKGFLLKDTTYFIRATDLGDEVIRTGQLMGRKLSGQPGFLGQCAGFNIFMSNAIPGDGGGYYQQFGGAGCISYAGQIRKMERIRRESTFGDAVRGLLLHDGTVFAEHAKKFGTIYTVAA